MTKEKGRVPSDDSKHENIDTDTSRLSRLLSLLKKTNWFSMMIFFAGLFVIVVALSQTFRMCLVDRSLWLDEAALAANIVTRSFSKLFSQKLMQLQAAPALFLLIAKSFTVLMGNTELALRMCSVVAFPLVILLTWRISKKAFGIHQPILPAALVASTDLMIRYSGEFKQYMTETFAGLFVLWIYEHFADETKFTWRNYLIISAIFATIIWLANPACFVIGGILAYEFFYSIFTWHKNGKARFLRCIVTSLITMTSFGVIYFWYSELCNKAGMQRWWSNNSLKLFPFSYETFYLHDWQLIKNEIFSDLIKPGTALTAFLILLLIGVIFGICRRNRATIVTIIALSLAFFASTLNFFPLVKRVWLFSFPFFIMLAFVGIDRIITCFFGKRVQILLWIFVAMLLTIGKWNVLFPKMHDKIYHYSYGNEINPLLNYIKSHMQEGESIYVPTWFRPTCEFKFGYGSNIFGKTKTDNVIWGTDSALRISEKALNHDVNKIENAGTCWLFARESWKFSKNRYSLYNELVMHGLLDEVLNFNGTILYYFEGKTKKALENNPYDAELNTSKLATELLVNNSFQDGLNGWSVVGNNVKHEHNEETGAFISIVGKQGIRQYVSQTVNVVSGKFYRVSCQSKGDKGAFIIWRDNKTKKEQYLFFSKNSEWRYYTKTFKSQGTGTYNVYFTTRENGTFYFANCSVVEKE